MSCILIVTETESFLLTSIMERLEKASYQTTVVHADTDAINDVKETVCGVLVYTDDKLLEQRQALNFLKDKAIMDDIPIFIIGDITNVKAIEAMIPKELVVREYTRPINVNDLAESVNSLIKQYGAKVKKKILVVDDSGTTLRNVKGWLEDRYNVILANSAAMAIKYLAMNRPDLVLLDYDMPVVDGKQVLEMIRTETEFTDIPVMFLTAKEDEESFLKVKDLKPERYMKKTMTPGEIVKSVDDFFKKRKGLKKP